MTRRRLDIGGGSHEVALLQQGHEPQHVPPDDPLRVAAPRGDVAQLAAERRGSRPSCPGRGSRRPGRRARTPARRAAGAAGELDALRRLSASLRARDGSPRSAPGEPREQPGAELDVLVAERGEPLLEQRHEPLVVAGPRPDDPPAVTGRGAGELVRQAERAARCRPRRGRRVLAAGVFPARDSRLAERRAAARSARARRRRREVERLERRLVQARGLLVGEQRERRGPPRAGRSATAAARTSLPAIAW